ncbi:MAG: UDP-N-acetylmuramoyl-L-alanine--D-glutamate ligase [Treponema sp.]|jgi:UDP-N-acetylmuramoylalanine--D-glutamate ligase|nr:UDP-N-acetylmuramoyl-L-alanine--D-glutamate ligase [Treponema sp.]
MDYSGIKALVMGLGLHGGGLAVARFLLKRGAEVTVTDLRDEKVLAPSIEELDAACKEMGRQPVRYVLGKHEIEDFKNAGIVIKNPGVKPDSPFLQVAKRIETDLSLFLSESPARLFAVTGSKGKSTTASALHWILKSGRKEGKAFLGGNITVSPLTFLDDLSESDDVVLELSSFQLGDLKQGARSNEQRAMGKTSLDGGALLKPSAAIITAIMADHMDRYTSMEEYVDDKRNIYRGQEPSDVTVAGDDEWGKSFRSQTKARPLIWSHLPLGEGLSGGWIENGRGLARIYNMDGISGEIEELVPDCLLTPGEHQKLNMLCAALASYGLGVKADAIRGALSTFSGIEHRLELFHEANGIRFYNDSAATIPEAAAACITALAEKAPLILVTGGSDKNLDFSPLAKAASKAKTIILLADSGSEKIASMLKKANIPWCGPFDNLDKAVQCAISKAAKGDIIALSPGCASFGLFLNEFDRGRKWKEACLRLC